MGLDPMRKLIEIFYPRRRRCFEFGRMEDRDRKMIRALLAPDGLLDENSLPDDILSMAGTQLPAAKVAKGAFDIMRSMFEQSSAKSVLRDSPVLGVMTDSLEMNAFADMLHHGEKFVVAVNAGVMLRATVSAYRLFGYREHQLGGMVGRGVSRFSNGEAFLLPLDLGRRKDALRCAMYATVAIFCHEIAHCFRGHLGASKMRLSEGGLDAAHRRDALCVAERRAMEVDADEMAGAFLTDIFFAEHKEDGDLLVSQQGKLRFESLAAGVLLALSQTHRSEIYFSGHARAYIMLGGLLTKCASIRARAGESPAEYLTGVLDGLVSQMRAAGIPPNDGGILFRDEYLSLMNDIDVRNGCVSSWLRNRPDWGDTPASRPSK